MHTAGKVLLILGGIITAQAVAFVEQVVASFVHPSSVHLVA